MNATTASLVARIVSTSLQAVTLIVMRQVHSSELQAQFFAIQTVLGLQFLAEFGAGQAMLQRLRASRNSLDRDEAIGFYARYSVLAGLAFVVLIAVVWLSVYDVKFAASGLQIGTLCVAGSLRLACVFLEVYIEGTERVADAYRVRLLSVITSQAAMLVAMILTSPAWALIDSALAYSLTTLLLRAPDVRTFFGHASRQWTPPSRPDARLRTGTGTKFQVALMLSSACGYVIFSGPVIFASLILVPAQVAEVGTAMLVASVASSLCGAVVAPRVVQITDAVLKGQHAIATRVENQLILVSAVFFVASIVGLIVVDKLQLKLLPPWSELMVSMIGYFCFTIGLIFSFALRAEGRDRMLVPSLMAAAGFVGMSLLALAARGHTITPLAVFTLTQILIFLPAAWLQKKRTMSKAGQIDSTATVIR